MRPHPLVRTSLLLLVALAGLTSCGSGGVADVSVSVTTTDEVRVGERIHLTALARDSEGNALHGRAVTWRSEPPGVATVDEAGRVTGVMPGSATIVATSEGKEGRLRIQVLTRARGVSMWTRNHMRGGEPYLPTLMVGRSMQVWAWMGLEQELRRTGTSSFELRAVDGTLLTHPAERFYRARPGQLTAGQLLSTRGMRVKVLETNDYGPTRLEVSLDRSLDDPSLRFLAWKDERLQPVRMPPVDGTLRLAGLAQLP